MAYNGGDSALASMTDPAANTPETNVASVGSPEKNTTSSKEADLSKSGNVASHGIGNGVETSDVASHGTGNGVETSNEEETGTDTSVNSGANNKNSTNNLPVPQTTPTLPKSQQTVQLDEQPMLTDLLSHWDQQKDPKLSTGITDDKDWIHIMTYRWPNWAYKSTVDILRSNNDTRYYFAGYVDYSESFHDLILLSRSRDLSDQNVYVNFIYINGAFSKDNTRTMVVAPNKSKTDGYGRKYDFTVNNFGDGALSVTLNGYKPDYGLLPLFDGGRVTPEYQKIIDTAKDLDTARDKLDTLAKTKEIGRWPTRMPENGVTTIRYVDQATGEDIATPIEFSGLGYQKYTIENQPPVIDGYTLNQEHVPASTGYISPYAVGETFTTVVDDHISIKTTVIDKDGHIRATAYKDGERFGGTATDKILGTASNNDKMPFMANGKSYTYENPVDMTRDEIVYYYANNEHSNSSQMNIHYVDVTNSGRTSDFISTDGSIISTVPVTGTIGESFADKIIAPAGYQILEKDELATNGIYTVKNHDAYVYVAKDNTSDNEKYTVETGSSVDLKHGKTIAVGDEVDPKAVVVKDSNGSPVGLPAGAKVVWTAVPNTSENGKGKTGHVKVIYGAGKESEPVDVTYNVVPSDIDKNDAKATDGLTTDLNKVPAAKDSVTVTDEKGNPVTDFEAEWAKDKTPDVSKPGKSTGTVEITYPDGSKETVEVPVTVRDENGQTQADKNDAKASDGVTTDLNKVPDAKGAVTVTDPDKKPVTDFEAEWAKDKTPDVSKPGKSTGTVEITYPDGSKETVEVPVTVRDENGKTQADKNDPKTPGNKVEVDDPTKLTDGEKEEVKDAIKEANPDLPKGEDGKETEITVGDDGTATITYPDGSVDTIPGKDLVEEKTDTPTPTEKTVNVVFKGVDKKYDGKPAEVTVTITDQDGKDVDVTLEAGKDYTITKQSAAKARMLLATAKPLTDAPTEVGTYHVALTEAGKQKLKDAGYTTVNETPADFTISPADTPTPTPDTKTDDEKYDPIIPGDKVKVDDPTKLTNDEKGQVEQAVKDANKDNFPEGTEVTTGNDGTTVVTYPDGTKDTIDGDKLVEPDTKTDDEKYDPIIPGDKVKVDDPTKLTNEEKDEVVKAVEDANKDDNGDSTLPDGTKITVDNDGTATVTYPDGTKDTIDGDKLVEPANPSDTKTDDQTNDPKVPGDKVKVDNPTKLTDDEKEEVTKAVEDANKDDNGDSTLPDGTKITVDNDGTATVTYPDGTKDTIDGDKLVEPANPSDTKTDDQTNDPKVPGDKVKVDNPTKLTDDEKEEVTKAVEDANKDDNGDSTLPDGTKITVDNDGTTTVTYPDGTKDTIDGDQLVEKKNDADKNEPNVPGDKVKVDDPTKLTDDEKGEVVKAVEDANKDDNGNSTLPDGTKITVDDNGDVTVTYPDGSEDTIPGDKVVEGKDNGGETGDQTDAEKNNPAVPGDKVKVDDPAKLTDGEKEDVVKAVEDANKDDNGDSTLPDGTKITVGDNGDVTVTYPDGSEDTIPGDKVVEGKTDADKNKPNVPSEDDKVKVDDPTKLTDGEKEDVVKTVEDANKDDNGNSTLPDGTKITVGDNGDVTVTYPDGSEDTIPGDKVVEGKDNGGETGDQTDAEKNNPAVPGDKVKVDDPAKLTDGEKGEVVKAVEDANKDDNGNSTLPDGTKITVDDNGDVTVTYPDGSEDTIPGDKVVEGKDNGGETGDQTDAEKNNPAVPGDKVKVDDPAKLTDGEKEDVVKAVEDANKDDNGNFTLPDGTKITVGDNGDVTVTYPDGSEDTIPGDKVVEGKTDADKNKPNVPSEDDKVKVDDPTKLTDGEKEDVVKTVEDANKDDNGNSTLPDGTKITVGDNGDVTVTYPDGSKDTIPGDKVVEGKTDADKTDVTVPGTKVEVGDPTKLTDGEKGQVEEAIKDANPNLPDGTKITVADDGTATILYPDGSHKVIDGQDLVTKPGQTTADQVTPVVPGDKVTVVDPNHLTDAEKDQVKTNVEKANQNNFPAGTVVTVADDGTATITYPDGSVDQISAADLITKPTAAGQAGKGTGTTTTNGQGAPAGQGKADQAKTLPQTGNEQGSLLAASGLGMLLLGMLGLGGKRKKED